MIDGWEEVTLGDLGQIVTGKTPPTSEAKYFGGEYMFVSPKDLGFDSRYINSTMTNITAEALSKHKNQVIPENTIMYTALSYGFGKLGIASSDCLTNQQINSVIVDDSKYDFSFVYYLLRSSKDYFLTFNAGIVTPIVPKSTFSKIKLVVPRDKERQQKIARILSAYDDLIENNQKRIKLLEEMAQLTYEEWFVRMKFPGHEDVQLDTETGLPEGWEKRSITDLCAKITDGTHDSPKEVENGVPLVTGRHILGGFIDLDSAYQISEDDHQKIEKRSGLDEGDILFSNIGTLGNIGVVQFKQRFSCKNVVIFKKKEGFNNFLYTYLSNIHTKQKLDSQSAGVAQKFYSLKFIRALTESLPSDDFIRKFDDYVAPIYATKFHLHNQNQLLKEARDILLPRLMTGIINVDEIEIPQESEVA